MSRLENVAFGKRATQSSQSKWSKPNDADRALDDDGRRDFAFHTDLEDNPWWMVDLGDQYPIHEIVIGNRRDGFQHKASSLVVEVSRDAKTWQAVHSGKLFWPDTLALPLDGEILARYVRLSLRERQYLHLSKVEVWTKSRNLTITERRGDGFGNRFQSLLNAAYLAKVMNCDLKVTWPDEILGVAGEFSADVKKDSRTILGHCIEPASEIFAPKFVSDHISNDRISAETKVAKQAGLRARDLMAPGSHDGTKSINAPMNGLKTILAPEIAPSAEYGLPDIFEQLPFGESMASAIAAARDVPIEGDSAAVHIRSGDIVYGNYRLQGRRFLGKAVPIPLARMAIERSLDDGKSVILFGEDAQALAYLRDTYCVTLASDHVEPLGLTGARRAMFEIVLMSRANVIWASDSGFAQTARDISRTAAFKSIHHAFTADERARYFTDDLRDNADDYDPKQAAFALWSLYWLAEDRAASERIEMLDRAARLDPDNQQYTLAKASLLLSQGSDDEGDEALGKGIEQGWIDREIWGGSGRTHILFGKYGGRFHLHDLFPAFYEAAERGVPNAVVFKTMMEEV